MHENMATLRTKENCMTLIKLKKPDLKRKKTAAKAMHYYIQ